MDNDLPVFGTEAIRRNTLALADLATAHPLDSPVATCGDWTLADLVWHLAQVQDFWVYIITNRPAGPDGYSEPSRPADDELAGLLADRCNELAARLDAADAADVAWSWSDDHTVGFTLRRQTHEALVHHVDGVIAVGRSVPEFAPALAADGVDELVTVMLAGVPEWATFERAPNTLRLVADDASTTWNLGFGRMHGSSPASGVEYDLDAIEILVDLEHPPTTTISARAIDLDLWLWGRLGPDALAVAGDPGGADRLRALVAESTQ